MFIEVTQQSDNQKILINLDDVSVINRQKDSENVTFAFKDDSYIHTNDTYDDIKIRLSIFGKY